MPIKEEKSYVKCGEDVLTKRPCQNCAVKFRSYNFDSKDAIHSGRPIKTDEDKINIY